MLRRKVSNGLLRATKSNSSLRATAQTQAQIVPPLPQTANLTTLAAKSGNVSSVGSKIAPALKVAEKEWGKETVVTLKQELKNRGLSQAGNKSVLVERLSAAAKPSPSTSSTAQTSQILNKTTPLTTPKTIPSSSKIVLPKTAAPKASVKAAEPTPATPAPKATAKAVPSTPVSKVKVAPPVTPTKAKQAVPPTPSTPMPQARPPTTPSRPTAPGPPKLAVKPKSKASAPPPSSFKMANSSPRSFSTTATTLAPPKRPAPKSGSSSEGTVSTEHVSSTGPNVSSQRSEAAKPKQPSPEEVTTAPGLPETKSAQSASKGLNVKMPDPKPEPKREQVIPVTPDNFRQQSQPKAADKPSSSAPKVMTVASASTHPAGGPSHAVHAAADATSVENAEPLEETAAKAAEKASSTVSDVFSGIGQMLPEVGTPKMSSGGQGADGEYRAPDRGLNDEERKGLYIMGGIVGLGWLLGGPKKDKKDKKKKVEINMSMGDDKGSS